MRSSAPSHGSAPSTRPLYRRRWKPCSSNAALAVTRRPRSPLALFFFFSSRRRHTRSVSAFLLNRSSDLGVNATPLPTVNTTGYIDHAAFLGTINPDTNKIPKHLFQGYLNIYNNYFKAPWMPDRTEANPNELNQDDAR